MTNSNTSTSTSTDTDPLTRALTPVTCIDCHQSVPFGWIDRVGSPFCPDNIGASGVQYGHRIPRTLYEELSR